VALLNGMMHVILREGLENRAFIEERTENFEALREMAAAYPPERAGEIAGLPAEEIVRAARLYAGGPDSAIFYTMGITQHVTGTDNVRSVANLALLCGMLGRPGTGVNPLRGQNNVQGACDMGCLPGDLPGYAKVVDPSARARAEVLWGGSVPDRPGLTAPAMIRAASERRLRGLYIMGENPLVTDPDTNQTRRALGKLDFLMVQDIFLTETAREADLVLPAACWGEKEGTCTSTARGVQRLRRALEAPGGAWPDLEILIDLARRFGEDWGFSSASEVFDDIARFVPSYGGMNYRRLEGGPLHWPCPTADHPGTKILHAERFPRSSGRATFSPVEWRPPHERPDGEYPLLATTGRCLYHYHSGSMTRRSAPGRFVEEMYLELHRTDAEAAGIVEGDRVRVSSRRGELEGRARLSDRIPPGMLFLPFHFGEAPANALTCGDVLDPISEIPGFKISAVRIRKVPREG
jgi:predicted molibdopterin-dependent oxidoreductase YjgC